MNETPAATDVAEKTTPTRWYRGLGAQVMIGMALGIVVGFALPGVAQQLKILGDIFLDLIKAGVAPLVFLTIVMGIGAAGNLGKASRIGLYGLVYFEVLSTFALVIGLIVANVFHVGGNAHVLAQHGDAAAAPDTSGQEHGFTAFVTGIMPDNFFGAFTSGQLLQVVILSLVFGAGLLTLPARYKSRVDAGMDVISQTLFGFVNVVMKLAPIGAFGAIAYAVGSSGTDMLVAMGKLIVEYWFTIGFFFFAVLGAVLAIVGINIVRLVRYFKVEMSFTLGTGSSESALPGILEKLPRLGLSKQVTGLVVPTGYAFNLDGTSIYMSICTLFLANIYGIHMGLPEQLGLIGIMLLTSKGAATVNGGTFVVFAATVAATGYLPTEGLPILFGVYQFMSRATATLNTFGNVVASLVVGRFVKELDMEQVRTVLADPGRAAEFTDQEDLAAPARTDTDHRVLTH